MVETYNDITTVVTKNIKNIKDKFVKNELIIGDSGIVVKEIVNNLFIVDNKINKLYDELSNIKKDITEKITINKNNIIDLNNKVEDIIKRLIVIEDKINGGVI